LITTVRSGLEETANKGVFLPTMSSDQETKKVAPFGKAPATTARTETGCRKALRKAVKAEIPMQNTTMKLLEGVDRNGENQTRSLTMESATHMMRNL
jgi:hypothetical protein